MSKSINGGRGWASDACVDSVHRLDGQAGYLLPITSAGRTYQEQADAYYRYRYQGGPLALPPGTSIHEIGNAIDWGSGGWGFLGLYAGLYDQGVKANENGHFRTVSSEIWHTEYNQSRDQYNGSPAGGVSGDQTVANEQAWVNQSRGESLVVDGILGPNTTAAFARYQEFLRDNYGYTGPIDGDWGPGTQAAHQRYYDAYNASSTFPARDTYGEAWVISIQNKLNRLNYGPLDEDGYDGPATQAAVKRFQTDKGLEADGIAGPITNNALDNALTAAPVGANITSRPTLDIQKLVGATKLDGDYGAETTQKVIEWQKANGLTPDGIWGPASDEKAVSLGAFTSEVTEWPVNGRNATTRPNKDIQAVVGMPADQQDDIYGPLTSVAVAKWQKTKNLDADGIWGPASDAVGFPGVPLPPPVVTPPDATYGKKIPTYPGATWADISPNKSVRTGIVQYFTVHHAADPRDKQTQIDRFMTANDRNVSPNWFIGADGSVAEIVPPDDYRAWTTGQWDHNAVTVETQNTSGDPTWGISRESHVAIAKIIAWAANRYKFPIRDAKAGGALATSGVIFHREVPGQATACPGPAMDKNLLITLAQDIFTKEYSNTNPPVDPDPEPEPEEPDFEIPAGKSLVDTAFLEQLRDNEIANAEEIDKYL